MDEVRSGVDPLVVAVPVLGTAHVSVEVIAGVHGHIELLVQVAS